MKIDYTVRERLAARLYILSGETISPSDLFTLAHNGSLSDIAKMTSLPSTASRWLRSNKISKLLNSERGAYQLRQEAERKKVEAEIFARVRPGEKDFTPAGMVDYSRPENQVKKLNQLVNTAKDSGEALDALKVLLSRQTELSTARREERQVRAYLPLSCHECPLYIEKKTKSK